MGKLFAVTFLHALQALGDAAEQQGQNYAGIAPRTAQHGRCGGVGDFCQGQSVQLLQLDGCIEQGHAHICARIAIGYGENIQFVDRLLVVFHNGSRADQHFLQKLSINSISQHGHLPLNQSSWSQHRC